MNINWVLANSTTLDPTVDLNRMKMAGAFWGSWQTWRACGTDNVICHNMKKSQELIRRAFHAACNFYIPNANYQALDRPQGVRLYEGDFLGHDVDNQDELIAINLAGSVSDVVLLVGFDWSPKTPDPDPVLENRARNYRGLVLQALRSRPSVQWVMVDHPGELWSELTELETVTVDTMENVFGLLTV